MKKTKRFLLLSMFVTILCITITITVSADSERVALFENEKCGTNAYATLYEDGELVITGSGILGDNEWDNAYGTDPWNYSPPWNYYYSDIKYTQLIKKITMSDGIIEIDYFSDIGGVFCDCVNMEEIVLSKNLEKIGSYAFRNCSKLKSIALPDSVTFICKYAFADCSKLKSITLPDRVTFIGDYAFVNCIRFEEIVLSENLEKIGNGAFENCIRLSKIIVENPNCEIANCRTTFPENAVLYGYKDSTLEKYADDWNRKFVIIGSEEGGNENENVTPENSHTHKLPENWIVINEVSCSQDGLEIKCCSNCSFFETKRTPAYGHSDGDGDFKCDECKVVISIPEQTNQKTNVFSFFTELFKNIIDFFKQLFNI